MSVPDFQSVMRPVFECLKLGSVIHAKEAAKGLNISVVLIDGKELAKLMIEHSLGVSIQETYHVKTMDSDYFDRF